jgi:hypothetical protein
MSVIISLKYSSGNGVVVKEHEINRAVRLRSLVGNLAQFLQHPFVS